jgi:ATP-dependent Clp protease adaptor protein ClpS
MVKQKSRTDSFQKDQNLLLRELILFNDDVNTFDFVIETLIDVCKHQPEQAEQCALIAHYNGKCMVRTGDFPELKPLYEEMTFRGLTLAIE